MNSNKYCCRIFPIILIIISAVIASAILYFNGNVHSFLFLTNKDEILNFIGTILFIAILPIGIFYLTTEKEQYKNNAKKFALIGFVPALIVLVYILVS